MKNHISRIAAHVYVKGGLEAVRVYKDAFGLEIKGEPLLDGEGALIYQELQLNGNQFICVSDVKYLGDEFKKERPDCVGLSAMNNCVYFAREEDLRRTFELLYKNGNPCSGFREDKEGYGIFSCDVDFIDKFGVSWYLCVRRDWDAPDPNGPSIPSN